MPTNVRVRFAPSPTGWLHIGSLRAVLFDYLIAKTLNGKLILRIEDTDKKRQVSGAVEGLINILNWAGIRFDEGPRVGGQFGPYIQSERLEIYKKQAKIILKKGAAYPCFCTEERLRLMKEEQQAKKLPPRYDRACRNLSADEVSRKTGRGEPFVIRQKMPSDGGIEVYDELRGRIKFMAADLEDQILIKSDGTPTYQLASVVDDHLMAISHVLRGEEWLSSFPKNILLYQAFGWTAPKFIHLALTLNKAGGKLSKRQGDVAVEDYKNKGYLPEALLNFCVLQSWHPSASVKAPRDKKDEILSLEQMIEYFDYKDMGTNPAVFDEGKLDYFNGYYIRQMSLEKLTELCLPYLVNRGMIDMLNHDKLKNKITGEEITFAYLKKVVALEQERLKKLSDIGAATEFFFADNLTYEPELLIWKKMNGEAVKKNLKEILEALKKIPPDNWTDDSLEEALLTHIQAKKEKVGDYLWPLRVALTGRAASPGPFEVAEILGREESLKRIGRGIDKI